MRRGDDAPGSACLSVCPWPCMRLFVSAKGNEMGIHLGVCYKWVKAVDQLLITSELCFPPFRGARANQNSNRDVTKFFPTVQLAFT